MLFLFLDGVGLGAADRSINPFMAAATPFLSELLDGPLTERSPKRDGTIVFAALDATLSHPGLPQSATGQASLLTGINCAEVMGRHYGPWPGPTLKQLLDGGTLFSEAEARPGGARLANAYPPGYFEALQRRRARENVPVHAARAAGLKLADMVAYRRGEAIPADLTGEHFSQGGEDLPTYSPEASGRQLAMLAADARFTFFDYWLSDSVGHRGSFAQATELVERLDRFLSGVVERLADVTLIVTSDHGNLEDKSTRGHTRAPVPLIAIGPARHDFRDCASITDVAPAIRTTLANAG